MLKEHKSANPDVKINASKWVHTKEELLVNVRNFAEYAEADAFDHKDAEHGTRRDLAARYQMGIPEGAYHEDTEGGFVRGTDVKVSGLEETMERLTGITQSRMNEMAKFNYNHLTKLQEEVYQRWKNLV